MKSENIPDVAIASSVQTLEDYLKTDVCRDRTIYCKFSLKSMGVMAEVFLKNKVESNHVHSIVFSDGYVIKKES